MLWKEQGVTVLAVSAVYDVFVFHRLKVKQILPAICKVSDSWHLGTGFTEQPPGLLLLPHLKKQTCSSSKRNREEIPF